LHVAEDFTSCVDELEVNESSRRGVTDVLHLAGDAKQSITEAGVLLHLPAWERFVLAHDKGLAWRDLARGVPVVLSLLGLRCLGGCLSDAFIDGLVRGAGEGHAADDADQDEGQNDH